MVINSLKKAEQITIKSSILIILLSITKTIVGLVSGSLVLLTDAIHSFTDLVTNFASIIGLRIAQRKPNEKFPFGFFKAESISSLFISLFIIYLAYEFLNQGIIAISQLKNPTNPYVTIITAASSILISYGLSRYLISNGKNFNSQSLIINGREKRVDVLTSIVVLIAIILSFLRIAYVEGLVTIIISLFIFYEGFSSIKDSVFSLMDISPSKGKERKIIQSITNIPGVEGYGNLKLRKAGPIILGEIDVMVRKEVSVKQARILCNQIETKAKQRINELSDLAVKIYPYEPSEKTIAMPVKNKDWLSNKFGRAKKFLLIVIDNKEVGEKKLINNPFINEKVKAGLKAANYLSDLGVDEVIVKKIGEIARNTLNSKLITINKTRKRKINSTLNEKLNK